MKIFQLPTFFHPVTGGIERHVYDLSKLLIEKGHKVEVLCSDSTKIGPRLKEKFSNISGIPVHRFRTLISLSYYHKFYPGIFFYLMRNDFDVIHVHGFRKIETYFALLIAKRKNKKVVLTTHNPFPTNSRSRFQDLLITIHDLTIGKLFVKYIDRIIILVNSEREIFIKKFNVDPAKIVKVPNALDDKFYVKGNAEQFYKDWDINPKKWNGVVVSASRINYAKGIQNLHNAVKKLPKTLFFIAGGDDNYLDKLKVTFSDCENIIFSGHFLSPEKLINMYSAADIFVLPSLHEAFGMVLLEALAQGVPVISTNQGGPNDFISEEVGILLPPEDQKLWKETIKGLLKDKDRRKAMSDKAKALSLKYNWDKQINKIIKIYKS